MLRTLPLRGVTMLPDSAKKWCLFAGLLLWALCDVTTAGDKQGSCSIASNYVVHSLGTSIGTVSAKIAGTATDNNFHAETVVNVNRWFFHLSLTCSETATIRNGKVVRYLKTIDAEGHHKEITGELNNDWFTVEVNDRGKLERKRFPVTDFTVTDAEYPEVTLATGEVRNIRVIDLENAEIVDRKYRHIAEEQMEMSGRITRVVVSDLVDKNAECRRWTAVVNGLPVVIRQDGKEKKGIFNPSYSVRQTKVSVES